MSTDEEQRALRKRIAALAPAILPKGIGAYSAAVLHYELRVFDHFKNLRQVGSITGLCPGGLDKVGGFIEAQVFGSWNERV